MTGADLTTGNELKRLLDMYAQAVADLAGDNKYDKLSSLLSAGNTNIGSDENTAFFNGIRNGMVASVLGSINGRIETLQAAFDAL